jgi:3-oxoadipate enol-lactonase
MSGVRFPITPVPMYVLVLTAFYASIQLVASLFAKKYPDRVEKLVLLHPVRNLAEAGRQGMKARAGVATSGPLATTQIANTVSAGAVSKHTAATNPTAVSFIRHLVMTTNPDAYAAACLALADSPELSGKDIPCELAIIAGEEDYLAGPDAVKKWAADIPNGKGTCTVLKDVGHWGAIENPVAVADALLQYLRPT